MTTRLEAASVSVYRKLGEERRRAFSESCSVAIPPPGIASTDALTTRCREKASPGCLGRIGGESSSRSQSRCIARTVGTPHRPVRPRGVVSTSRFRAPGAYAVMHSTVVRARLRLDRTNAVMKAEREPTWRKHQENVVLPCTSSLLKPSVRAVTRIVCIARQRETCGYTLDCILRAGSSFSCGFRC